MKNDMISIIIPIYNREAVIEECIASVQAQSYQNFQIVIIDDGSSDKSFEICQSLANNDTRIKLISSEHVGVSAARNCGIDSADGEYIFFLDSDDVIHPSLLETLVCSMKQNNAQISGTCVESIMDKSWDCVKEKMADTSKGETVLKSEAEALNAMFHGTTPLSVIGGVMMRRDLIGETRFSTELFIGEDYYFIYENVVKGAVGVFLKQRWYFCRIHSGNISKNYGFEGFWTRFHRRELVWKNEEKHGRINNAKIQKNDAMSCFLLCIRRNRPYSDDAKRMRSVMRRYMGQLLPALSISKKVFLILAANFPFLYPLIFKAVNNSKKTAKK